MRGQRPPGGAPADAWLSEAATQPSRRRRALHSYASGWARLMPAARACGVGALCGAAPRLRPCAARAPGLVVEAYWPGTTGKKTEGLAELEPLGNGDAGTGAGPSWNILWDDVRIGSDLRGGSTEASWKQLSCRAGGSRAPHGGKEAVQTPGPGARSQVQRSSTAGGLSRPPSAWASVPTSMKQKVNSFLSSGCKVR